MLDQTSERDQTSDIEVRIQAAHEDPAFAEFYDDATRNRQAIDDAEFVLLAEHCEREARAALRTAAGIDPRRRDIHDADEILGTIDPATVNAFNALVELRCGRNGAECFAVDEAGNVRLLARFVPMTGTEVADVVAWIDQHNAATVPAKSQPAPAETRVSCTGGGKFKAEARLNGGRWCLCGIHADENDAYAAAKVKAQTLIANA